MRGPMFRTAAWLRGDLRWPWSFGPSPSEAAQVYQQVKNFTIAISLVLALSAPAAAQQRLQHVLHNGSLMSLEAYPDHRVVIRYVQPAPRLYGFVNSGMVLVDGHWDHERLYATAYVFTRECGAFPYHVEGGVAPNGDLVLEGAAPYVVEGCWVYGYQWDSHNTHLVFTQVAAAPMPPVEGLMQ
jgi:hypothetical protein